MNPLHKPNAEFFKVSMKQKQVAIDFLRLHLDPEILKLIDCNTLELIDKSFVSPDLQKIYVDSICRCRFKQEPGYIYFYILFEYDERNSIPEELAAFYTHYYVMNLTYDCIQQGAKLLPLIIPMYIYGGSISPYPYSRDIHDCFEHPQLARQLALNPIQPRPLTMPPA